MIHKYIVKGTARPIIQECRDFDDSEENIDGEVLNKETLKMLAKRAIDGCECFSDYFESEESFSNDVYGGYLRFEYDEERGILLAVTSYNSTRALSEEEQQRLLRYTQGQWSDGIGECYEQECCFTDDDYEYFISPWRSGQEITITHEEEV